MNRYDYILECTDGWGVKHGTVWSTDLVNAKQEVGAIARELGEDVQGEFVWKVVDVKHVWKHLTRRDV